MFYCRFNQNFIILQHFFKNIFIKKNNISGKDGGSERDEAKGSGRKAQINK